MFQHYLSKVIKADTGNLSIIFAAALVALTASAGVAVDLIGAGSEKARTDAAADAGVLAAVRTASEALIAGDSQWKNRGKAAGEQAFLQNLGSEARQHVGKLDVKITQTGNSFNGKLAYEYAYQTSFMRMFKQNEMKVADEVMAGMSIPSYIDVHFLIDNSHSMGIGATNADQQLMYDTTGCSLACHYSTSPTLPAVRAAGAKLRIDVVKEAVQQFLADAKIKRSSGDQIRVSIHTFSNQITQVQAPTTDLDAASASAGAIDLAKTDYDGGTNITYSLQLLDGAISAGGDGLTPGRRQSFVILLSDGVETSVRYVPLPTTPKTWSELLDPNWANNAEQYVASASIKHQTFNPSACDALKAKNQTVLTARVHYLRPLNERPGDTARLNYFESVLEGHKVSAFAACASRPEYSVEAIASSDIAPMFDNLLDRVFAPSVMRLTQ